MFPYFYVPWSLIRACTPLLSSIYALRTFFLLYIMLLQLKAKVPLFCVCTPINHSSLPASLLSSIFSYKTILHIYFLSFISNRWLHDYLYNYFPTTFSHFLLCFYQQAFSFHTFNTWAGIVRIVTVQTSKNFSNYTICSHN